VLHLSGGRLCLDLANTASWRGSDQPIERLNIYRDLVGWSRQAGILPSGDADRLMRAGSRADGRQSGNVMLMCKDLVALYQPR
jgi:hypothetical protein